MGRHGKGKGKEKRRTGGESVAFGNPQDQIVESLGIGTEPHTLRLRADDVPLLVLKQRLQVTEEIVLFGGGSLVLDVVGGVVIHAIEIIRAFDERDFLVGEGGETFAELLSHGVGVLT